MDIGVSVSDFVAEAAVRFRKPSPGGKQILNSVKETEKEVFWHKIDQHLTSMTFGHSSNAGDYE